MISIRKHNFQKLLFSIENRQNTGKKAMQNNENSIQGKIGLCVVGLGRAGKARCNAIEEIGDCSLIRTYSRRTQSSETWNSIIQDPRVDAVVICTENESHNMFIQEALSAKIN